MRNKALFSMLTAMLFGLLLMIGSKNASSQTKNISPVFMGDSIASLIFVSDNIAKEFELLDTLIKACGEKETDSEIRVKLDWFYRYELTLNEKSFILISHKWINQPGGPESVGKLIDVIVRVESISKVETISYQIYPKGFLFFDKNEQGKARNSFEELISLAKEK
ncbi:MAG: hypothetical protein NTX66_00725 [Candidatus Falkowbacteria bacterium]|nr:hypothetical protein [Candidatus Falkowbacteria bacterium]